MTTVTSLKSKSDLHLARKIWHCLGVLSMIAIYLSLELDTTRLALGTFAAVLIPLDFLRKNRPALNKLVIKIFGPLMRKYEAQRLMGISFMMMGAFAILLVYGQNEHIIVLTLLFLAFGDPVASYFGIKYGKDKILKTKSLQGTAAAFVTCSIIAAAYYYHFNLMTERLLIVSILSGFIGAGSELIPLGRLDDNLSFPIICATFLWILFYVYGGFV